MTANKHTPGPWIVHKGSRWSHVKAENGDYIMEASRRSVARHHADAHLIAAAPDLLEALTAAVAAIDKGGLDDVMCCNGWECGCRAATNGELLIHDLRVVIAKATGGAA